MKEQDQSKRTVSNFAATDTIAIFSAGSLGRRGGNSADLDLQIASEKTTRLDRRLDFLSDFFSSIVVKETRQSIKSRLFIWTFFATICFTLMVSVFNLAADTQSQTLGRNLLMSYLVVMGLPLMLIVPLNAFQSLSAEHSDGTLQLISITTMKPSQVILGKLGSSVLQVVIYMSVLAPCVTFTYLLRGVDVYQILSALSCGFVLSISLCSLGLAIGSASTTRLISGGLQIVYILVLLFCLWMWIVSSWVLAFEYGTVPPEGRLVISGIAGAIVSFALLLIAAATAQITFASENRSTYLRLTMLFQQVVFWGFVIGFGQLKSVNQSGFFGGMYFFQLHYWLFMGCLITATPNRISNRVRRSMPRGMFGKAFVSLLIPGPGRGFLFCWVNGMLGCLVVAAVAMHAGDMINETMLLLPPVYFSLYLSAVYLFNRMIIGPSEKPALFFGVLGLGIVIFFPAIFAGIMSMIDPRQTFVSRSLLSFSNWYQALIGDYFGTGGSGAATGIGILAITITAVITTFCAMLSSCREFAITSVATPANVLIEDRQHAARSHQDETVDELFDDD